MPINNSIECNDNYSKTWWNFWHYYRDEPNANSADSKSFKSEIKTTGSTRNVKVKVWLKYLIIFWRIL